MYIRSISYITHGNNFADEVAKNAAMAEHVDTLVQQPLNMTVLSAAQVSAPPSEQQV